MHQISPNLPAKIGDGAQFSETPEQRARRLFDEQARNIGRELVNYMKRMFPDMLADRPKTHELSIVNHVRNDINYRLKPLLMASIAMHKEWQAEIDDECDPDGTRT